ncbi:hypothetical protein GCM10023185_24400 [Hymenobacter saemangeumensis]|uniref:Rhodanese domain-containing protein n=1 Tax=Hymenobacter saemangeumensis TaxID=1084522 RepID=A0ABP8IH37_9BACT
MKFLGLLLVLAPLSFASRAQTSQSEPLRANQAQPAPSHTALLASPATAAAAVKLLADSRNVVLDVRTPAEFAAGHLQGAQNVDFRAASFQEQVAQLNPQKTYILYCASGNRSGQAAALMQKKGFGKVINAGGYNDLKVAGAK